MQLKISQVIGLPLFYNQVKGVNLPINTAYKLSLLKKEIDFHMEFYQENFQKIILDCGELDENGIPKMDEENTGFKIKEESMEECTKRIQDLMNLVVDFPEITFSLHEFEGIKLKIEDLEPALPFIK